MKKNFYLSIKFIVILLLLLTAIDWVITTGLKNNRTRYYGKLNKICQKEDLPQIAIFGSSVGEMGFDARLIQSKTGKSTYNFSLTGTKFVQYRSLIDEINEPKNNIETVVIADVVMLFQKASGLTEIQRYLPYISNNNIYNSLYPIQPDLVFKARYIPFYKYIATTEQYFLQSSIGWKNLITNKKNTDSLLGQIAVKRGWEADLDSILKYEKPISTEIENSIVVTYKEIIRKLVSNGKKVIITIPPLCLSKGGKQVDLTELRKMLTSIADNKNVLFWDFSASMTETKYFYNVFHLNAYGASIFSSVFADSLKTLK